MALRVVLLACASCHAPLPGPPVCHAAAVCASSEVCVLGRCRDVATTPVSTLAQRTTLHPTTLATSVDNPSPRLEVFDGRAPAVAVLDFAPSEFGPRIERALLVFEAEQTADARAGVVSVELAEIGGSFDPRAIGPHSLPRADLPMRAGTFPWVPGAALRVDVTELVRTWSTRPLRRGLVVTLFGQGGVRARYAVDGGGRVSPRLDIFNAPAPGGATPTVTGTPSEDVPAAEESEPAVVDGAGEPDDRGDE